MVAAGSGSGVGPAEALLRARSVLLAPPPGARRLGPGALRAALVELHDFWLSARATAAGVGRGTALVAVGGLGRRDLAPYSDLDLVLVHEGRGTGSDPQAVQRIAAFLWYPLWDAGIGLDHSVRTVGEAVEVAMIDLRVALGLLEARPVAGDAELAERLTSSVRKAWRAGIRGRFDNLETGARARWATAGEVAHRVEPDLKNGHGGLRDLQLLDALATAQLVDQPAAEVQQARRLILDVRTELHRRAGRARDVLHAQDADELAVDLGWADRFDLARALSGAARTVVYATDVALRSARAALPRRGLGALRRAPVRRPLDEGVVEHAGEITLARHAQPARDPGLVLRVGATAARTGLPVAESALLRLAEVAPELREPWPPAALTELLALLGSGPGMIDVIEALDRTGLWGRLFPEWATVRDLAPRDRAHVWTVDRHLVEVCAHASTLTTRVSRPDLLLLGALLHDIGKGRHGASHSQLGARIAGRVGRRLGLDATDIDTLTAMVRHHLLLPHTAARRDPQDPATVQRVVDTVEGHPLLLELLHALAEADARGTGPGVWTGWRSTLTGDLVRCCRVVMAGGAMPAPAPLGDDQLDLARSVAATGRPEVSMVPTAGLTTVTVTVAAPDRPGLLSRAAGVLALHSLQVHTATLDEHQGVAVDTFAVSPRFGRLPETSLVREDLVRALQGSLDLAARLTVKERDYHQPIASPATPRVLWFDDEATGAVILELRTTDRLGLLHRVAAALDAEGVDVRWARLSTRGASVIDAFCLQHGPDGHDSTPDRTPGLPPAHRARIEAAVIAATGS